MLCTKAGNLLCLEPEGIWELVLPWPFTSWESLGEGKLREMLGQARWLYAAPSPLLSTSHSPYRSTSGGSTSEGDRVRGVSQRCFPRPLPLRKEASALYEIGATISCENGTSVGYESAVHVRKWGLGT